MLKKLVFACSALLIMGFGQFISAQEASKSRVTAVNPASNDRDQDGLNGPVRRVRVDSSKIIIQNGKSVEGPKALREITTYDITGRRIDTVAHPVEGSS